MHDKTPERMYPPSSCSVKSEKSEKLFPIFCKPNPGMSTSKTKTLEKRKGKKSLPKTGSSQYMIDVGQNHFGATQCTKCGVIYQIGDPVDEEKHEMYHNATDVLRFNSWREECIVHRSGKARCLRVRGSERGWRRVENLLTRLVRPELGCDDALPRDPQTYTAYLYIESKTIIGCLLVEPRIMAHRFIPGDPDCCSTEKYPVKIGISRIWTHESRRRRGVARTLVDCARASTLPEAIPTTQIAFSGPTTEGKAFATAYCGTGQFYVYLD